MATLHIDTSVYLSGDKVYSSADEAPPDSIEITPGSFRFVRDMDGVGGWITLFPYKGLMPWCYVPLHFGHLLTKLAKHLGVSDTHNFATVRPKPKPAVTGVSRAKGSRKKTDKVSDNVRRRVVRKLGGFNPFANL